MTTALLVLAATIYMESAGEGPLGQKAVADVIHNRALAQRKTPVEICLQPRQFSCWNTTSLKTVRRSAEVWAKRTPQEWENCLFLAEQMLIQAYRPTITSNYYYNPSHARPAWRGKLKGKFKLGNHVFGCL